MDAKDALFEDMQALSDDAEALGLSDVALVLEFAMDIFLRDFDAQEASKAKTVENSEQPVMRLKRRDPLEANLGWSMSNFPLAQFYREAS